MGKLANRPTSKGIINPLRIKGRYQDGESGFYYLQSRYYDPAIGRFISADTFATTDANSFLSCNMFAYCENDPVNREDPSGELWNLIAGAAIGAIVNVAGQMIANSISGNALTEGIGAAAISGAVTGAFAATGLGRIGQSIVGAVTNGAVYAATHRGNSFKRSEFLVEVGSGAVSGLLGGNGLLKGNNGTKAVKQIRIIDANMHAVKSNWKAARSVAVSYSRIRGHVHKTVNQYIGATVIASYVKGRIYRSM